MIDPHASPVATWYICQQVAQPLAARSLRPHGEHGAAEGAEELGLISREEVGRDDGVDRRDERHDAESVGHRQHWPRPSARTLARKTQATGCHEGVNEDAQGRELAAMTSPPLSAPAPPPRPPLTGRAAPS
eukprot:760956-Hanusia_phi.AAC.2